MALNLKYTFSTIGNQSGETYLFKIYEEAFAGTARTFTSGWGPRGCIVVKTDTSETDMFFPIRPKVCELSLFLNCIDDVGGAFTETDLTAIMFAEPRTLKFELLKNSAIILSGWFTPQQSVSWNAYKFGQITLSFTDGLSSLKGIDYQLPDEYNYEVYSFRKIIIDCLNQTGLKLDTYYSNTLYFGADTDLLIDRIGLETVALRQDNGTQKVNCYDALSMLMRSIGCVLFQKGNKWHIESFSDKSQTVEAYATILYSAPSASLTLTSGTFATETLINSTRMTIERSMMVNAFKPKSKVNATASYSNHVHASVNYLFRDFTGNNPDRWTFSSGNIVTRQAGSGLVYGVDIQGYANGTVGFVDENIRSDGYPVKKGDRILIDWRFNTLATDGAEAPQPRVQIRVNDLANMTGTTVNESLKEDDTWQSGIYWLQQGNNGVFTTEVTVNNNGFLFMLIGRPYLSSAGIASQTRYYTSCEFFDVTILNGRQANEIIESEYKSVQQVIDTGKKYVFVDERIDHIGMNDLETPNGVSLNSDYYVTVLKNALTRDNLAANVRSDELLSGAGTLLLQVARLRGMAYSSQFISIEVQLIGDMVDVFDIVTLTILGASRRLVCVGIETSIKEEKQSAIFIQSLLASEAGLSNSINLLTD